MYKRQNRLLLAQSADRLVLRFQASPALLGTPLEALAGVAPDGSVAWLNTAAARLVGRLPESGPRDVERVFGLDLATLLRLGRREAAQPVRLASGLGVWLQARLHAHDGVDFRHAIGMAGVAHASAPVIEAAPPSAAPEAATGGDGTLRDHSRRLIEDTLAAHAGNISHAARQLRVSRGTLYRRLRRWKQDGKGD